MLKIKNSHPRDKKISLEESTHKYTINGNSNYKSVTTWVHEYFSKFNSDKAISKMRNGKNWNEDNIYYNMTDNEIKDLWSKNGKEASELGTKMHQNIENYYNDIPYDKDFENTKEYELFQEYLKDHKEYIPYRTEWNIYSMKYKLAGSVDILYIDPEDENKYIIADWKRSKEIKFSNDFEKGKGILSEIDNCNYWHYVLQLNVYKMLLENYYDKIISGMFLVILHPNQSEYIKIDIPNIDDIIIDMFSERLKQIQK